MKSSFLLASTVAVVFSTSAMADHNSIHGAGWANMPNDIHNTRIEDDLSTTEFRDFVRRGAGADTVNRYLDTTTSARGNMSGAMSGGTSGRAGR